MVGILRCSRRNIAPSLPEPRDGDAAGGAGSRGASALRDARVQSKSPPELGTVPLCVPRNASPFWIILLLVLRNPEHQMIEPIGPSRWGDGAVRCRRCPF